tara:strand:- start:156 stop:1217 length:1062 start_codon:yes stop_codon:yes gene_type:complete
MRTFFNYFFKIFAIFSASTLFLLILISIFYFTSTNQNKSGFSFKEGNINSENKIALLKLNGPILNEPINNFDIGYLGNINIIFVSEVENKLNNLKKEKIKGLIVVMNSPGGSVSASYNLYQLFSNFKNDNKIPIYFYTSEILASGAYWAALSGDKIFANYGSLIGSIGVKGPEWIYYDEPISFSSGLLGPSIETKKGIKKFNNIAGNSKDLFDPFRTPTTKELKELQSIVNEIYFDFVNVVSQNRKIENDVIINDIGAMIFDPNSAKKNFLIDGILQKKKVIDNIFENLNIKDFQIIENIDSTNYFFGNLIKGFFYSKEYFNNLYIIQNEKICNVIQFELSALLLKNNFTADC